MLKTIPNPCKRTYDEVTKAVKDNDNYCPCSLLKNENTKCQCVEFKEQTIEGFCHCGRYQKILVGE